MSEQSDKEFVNACTKFRTKFTANAEEFDSIVMDMFKEVEQQNEALLAQVEELREFIEGIGEYALRQESYKEVSLIRKFLSKTPQQSLDSLKSRIEEDVIHECVKEICKQFPNVLGVAQWINANMPRKYQTTELLEK